MKKNKILATVFSLRNVMFIMIFFCFSFISKVEKENRLLLQTNYGTMTLKLYNLTPLHRDNMMKLVKEKYYDSLLFHRVIKDFMIQCGDPTSKAAPARKLLGMGGPSYTIPAEFYPQYIHKKGAIAAARNENPTKASSGSQFYIVKGKKYTDEELTKIQDQRIEKMRQKFLYDYLNKPENKGLRDSLYFLEKNDQQQYYNRIEEVKKIIRRDLAEFDKYKYTQEQRTIYKTIGGTPFLDYEYTVFGEVVEGLDILEKISNVETDKNSRPRIDVVMKLTVVK